jgi:hypothetical protein
MRWSCLAVERRLAEYHDGELTIEERVAVQAHLRACPTCTLEADRLETLGSLLRASASHRAQSLDPGDLDGLADGVVSRLKAEDEESLPRTLERMFEDLHFVWAALGATAATVACIAITVGLFCFFSQAARPDSLAAVIGSYANPGSNTNPVPIDERTMALPRPSYYESLLSLPDLTRDEEMWALNATITREGRVTNMQLLSQNESVGHQEAVDLLDIAASSRFQPAYRGDTPIAVKMVWLLAHLTVRPKVSGEVHIIAHPTVV